MTDSLPKRRDRSRRLGNESLFSRYKAELLEGGAFTDVEEARMECPQQ
jgi:hypothetical protein